MHDESPRFVYERMQVVTNCGRLVAEQLVTVEPRQTPGDTTPIAPPEQWRRAQLLAEILSSAEAYNRSGGTPQTYATTY